jgi:DNA mismatch endonuclease (patch repair protein)
MTPSHSIEGMHLTQRVPQQRDPAMTSRIMSSVRARDTQPELALRRALHARGLRYRVDARNVPGRPDLVNRARKVAVFVDGDYWHGNPDEWRRRGFESLEAQFPHAKREFWVTKIEGNMGRDREVNDILAAAGWTVVRAWESELRANLEAVVDRVSAAWGT